MDLVGLIESTKPINQSNNQSSTYLPGAQVQRVDGRVELLCVQVWSVVVQNHHVKLPTTHACHSLAAGQTTRSHALADWYGTHPFIHFFGLGLGLGLGLTFSEERRFRCVMILARGAGPSKAITTEALGRTTRSVRAISFKSRLMACSSSRALRAAMCVSCRFRFARRVGGAHQLCSFE